MHRIDYPTWRESLQTTSSHTASKECQHATAASWRQFNLELGSQDNTYPEADTDRKQGCIRDMEHPYLKDGGLAVLFGNLAEDCCIVKTAGVDASILRFEGKARVFESQEEACEGILSGKVKTPATW